MLQQGVSEALNRLNWIYWVAARLMLSCVAMATVQSDIFKPTKYGGKYTVTLIPGMDVSQHDILRRCRD
jgi:hypothetical protein